MKRLSSLLVVLFTVVALGSSTPAYAQKTVLKMWTFLATQGTDPRATALRAVVDNFNASQSKWQVEVESINFAQIDNRVIQATAAGQGPDILNVYSDQLSMHVAAKTIQPLDQFTNQLSEADRNNFVSNLKFFTFDGKLMALPWETRVWLLWYRNDLLKKAGLQVPKTLAELGTVANKISTDQIMGFGFGASTGALGSGAIEAFTPIFWGAGGQLFDKNGKTAINSPAGVKTLHFFRDLVTRDKGMRQSVVSMSVEDAFTGVRAGTIGMTVMGSFRVGGARTAEATGANLQTAPIPGFTADKPTPARLAAQTLTIGANSKNADGAWAFIQYYLSDASQLAFAKAAVMPSRLSAYDSPEFRRLANAQELLSWRAYAHDYGRIERTPADFSKLSEQVATAIQRVIVSSEDPQAALDLAAQTYNSQH